MKTALLEWRNSNAHSSTVDHDDSILSNGDIEHDELHSRDATTSRGSISSTRASKDESLPAHDDVVARAVHLLVQADKIIHASYTRKQETLIQGLVSRINHPQHYDQSTIVTCPQPVSVEDKSQTACRLDHNHQYRCHDPSPVVQPSKRLTRWTHVLLVWKKANGSYACKVPTARIPTMLQLEDILPFACALWASGSQDEAQLPNDLLCAKLKVVLFHDAIQCDFVPHGEAHVPGRNYFCCTVLTQHLQHDQRLPRTEQQQKPYLCLIMALLRRLRSKLVPLDHPHGVVARHGAKSTRA